MKSFCIFFLFLAIGIHTMPLNFLGTADTSADITSAINEETTSAYNNPIDDYYLPRIEKANPQAELRQLQDDYKGVWKSEFEYAVLWIQEKFKYQEDKNLLEEYTQSLEHYIALTLETEHLFWEKGYLYPPGQNERTSGGMGTRSGLNFIEGQLYRDACMRLITLVNYQDLESWESPNPEPYTFRQLDYSQEHYE